MNPQEALSRFQFPRGLIKRTQPRHKVAQFTTKTYDGHTLIVDVYEADSKWFVVSTNAFAGWTDDSKAAFGLFNSAQYYRLSELEAMVLGSQRDQAVTVDYKRGRSRLFK